MLPGRVQPSTFGTERLNFCVRDGNRWDPLVIATGNGELFSCGGWVSFAHDSRPAFACRSSPVRSPCACFPLASTRFPLLPLGSPCFCFLPLALPRSSPHPDNCTAMILTDRFQLVSLLDSALNQALDRLVSSSSIRYRTSTDDLSTW